MRLSYSNVNVNDVEGCVFIEAFPDFKHKGTWPEVRTGVLPPILRSLASRLGEKLNVD